MIKGQVLYGAPALNINTYMPVISSVKVVNNTYCNTMKPWTTSICVQEPKFAFTFLNLCIENKDLYKAPPPKRTTCMYASDAIPNKL